ncbi:MAG: hypothetical protein Q8N37_02055 [bacterium]|nr:hypothetical protein [bacterium]
MDSEKFVPEEAKEEYRTIKIGGKEVKIKKPKRPEVVEAEEKEQGEPSETEVIPEPGWENYGKDTAKRLSDEVSDSAGERLIDFDKLDDNKDNEKTPKTAKEAIELLKKSKEAK